MAEQRRLRQINLRLTGAELADLDEARGGADRNAWIRGAIYKRLGRDIPVVADGVSDGGQTIAGARAVAGEGPRELAAVPDAPRRGVAA